jgi:ElaB/YqjD/DUF883 family membrane-anchored ribosome-binding protein
MTADSPRGDAPDNVPRETAGDDAFARLEKEMIAMKRAIGGLSNHIADAASDVGAVAQDQAERGLKHAHANVEPLVAGASDRVGAVANAAQVHASSMADTLEDVIRDRPLSSVAIALGLGFLIGVAWRR